MSGSFESAYPQVMVYIFSLFDLILLRLERNTRSPILNISSDEDLLSKECWPVHQDEAPSTSKTWRFWQGSSAYTILQCNEHPDDATYLPGLDLPDRRGLPLWISWIGGIDFKGPAWASRKNPRLCQEAHKSCFQLCISRAQTSLAIHRGCSRLCERDGWVIHSNTTAKWSNGSIEDLPQSGFVVPYSSQVGDHHFQGGLSDLESTGDQAGNKILVDSANCLHQKE